MKKTVRQHPFLFIFGLITLFCLALLLLFPLFPSFSEWFARYPARFVRLFLGDITSPLPFSLFEILIALFILYLLFLLVFIPISLYKKKKSRILPLLAVIPILLLGVLDLFALSFASSYYRVGTAEQMALDTDVKEEDVFFALESLVGITNDSAKKIEKNEKGESVPPSFDTVKESVCKAADAFGEKNPFYQDTGFEGKTFLSSPFLTYTHLSGVFGFFTGEANVNTNYPHFIVTASLAHESCHARGIGPENECNFLAAVILMESDDPYLRYCGASFLLDDFISACRGIDKEKTNGILQDLDGTFFADMAFYSDFFEPYRDSFSSKVADTTNTAYLKAMGQKDGVLSYSRVIGLTSAYFQQKTP